MLQQRGSAQLVESQRTIPSWRLAKPVRVREQVPMPEAHSTLPPGSKRTGLLAIKAGMTQVHHTLHVASSALLLA